VLRPRPAGPTLFGIDLSRALARVLINAIAIVVAANVLSGITVSDWKGLLFAAVVFGLVNAFIKPAVQILTCPLYLVTLGLFAIVVNAEPFHPDPANLGDSQRCHAFVTPRTLTQANGTSTIFDRDQRSPCSFVQNCTGF
jgi:uncharacterized membrane protein YvlD (DUF360 family)